MIMAKQTTNNLKLGLFVTVALLLFTATVYYIGNKQNMFGESIKLSSTFANVNGLQSGNNVRYSGINVGTVTSIEIINDTTIQVDMLIEKSASAYIRKDAIATISSDGLVGNMMISIVPSGNMLDVVKSGDMIESYSKINTSEMLNTLNVTNENAAILTADLLKITQGILEKQGTFGTLLYDTQLALDLKATLQNLKQASVSISDASISLKLTANSLNDPNGLLFKLSSDTVISNSIDITVQNLKQSSDKISNASSKLNALMEDFKLEDGAINTIVYDTAFANDLKQSMENINQGTARFNQNMEALKHNFLTRRYFKKLEKENK